MNILVIAPPILKNVNDKYSWLTVPPLGYGGIENVIDALINGLIHHGSTVTLIGVPGSNAPYGLTIVRDARTIEEIRLWINKNAGDFDIIHDHSGGVIFGDDEPMFNYIATHHKTGHSPYPKNTVCLSEAQKRQSKLSNAPVIRLPIIFNNFLFITRKKDYYLFLGRVSEFKGVIEAAALCEKLGVKLLVAGPSWEADYMAKLMAMFPRTVSYQGIVFGLKKIDLLAYAKGVFVLSRFSKGPWGDYWCEPGATIVGEAAASGTPIISSTNGCLSEIVVADVGVQLNEKEIENADISKLMCFNSNPYKVFNYAKKHWNHITISEEYLLLYDKIKHGFKW